MKDEKLCEPLRSFVVAASVQRLCATVTSIRALPVAVILNWGGEVLKNGW